MPTCGNINYLQRYDRGIARSSGTLKSLYLGNAKD
jgi:hypothetical protein